MSTAHERHAEALLRARGSARAARVTHELADEAIACVRVVACVGDNAVLALLCDLEIDLAERLSRGGACSGLSAIERGAFEVLARRASDHAHVLAHRVWELAPAAAPASSN
jgi:hypothetical protein